MPDETPENLSPEKFIYELWATVPKEWFVEFQFIQYRPTQENPTAKRSRSISYSVTQILKDWDTLSKELTRHNRTQVENIHHSVNPRFRRPTGKGGAGKNDDVTAYIALWVDVDYGMNSENVRKEFFETVEELKKIGLGPSVIIESGRGLHGYWLLDKPYPTTTARPFCAGIQDYFRISDAINDPRRILRLPGFLNLKDPNDPKWCKVVDATWMRYPLEAFKDFSVEPTKTEEEKGEEQHRQETFTVSRDPEVEKIKEGPIEEGTRHESALKLVGHYAAKLKTKKQVLYVANDWNEKKCEPPLPQDELDRIVDDLWTKEQIKRAEGPTKREKKEKGVRPQLPWFDEDGKFNPAIMAAYFMKEHRFISTPIARDGVGIDLFRYQEGVFRTGGYSFIRGETASLLGTNGRMKHIEEVMKLVNEYAKKPYEEMNKESKKLLNLKNGMLDWKSGDLKPHSPEFNSLMQIPVSWDPKATCSKLDEFLASVFPPDALAVVEEFMGYLLIPNTSFAKCLVLVGEGGNGKSTFLKILCQMLGQENISFYSLHSISEEQFAAAGLFGKLANFYDELESKALENTGIFKQIVSGDAIKAEEKNKAPFSFRPFCRLVFATNQMPRAKSDKSEAYFDRFIFVNFPNRIRGTQTEVKEYDQVLAEVPGFMEALIFRAIGGLRRLMDRGRFSPSGSVNDALEEYRRECNSAYDFLREACSFGSPESWVSKSSLYDYYRAWSGDTGRRPMSSREFTRTLKTMNVREVRHGHGRGWGGVAWANGGPPPTTEGEIKAFGEVSPSPNQKDPNLDF